MIAVRVEEETGADPLVTSHLVTGSPPAVPLTGLALHEGLARAAAEACRSWTVAEV
jgi:glycerate kinase